MSESASQRQRAANLFQHTVERLRAADVKADEDGIRIRIGERSHVVIVRGPCRRRRGKERRKKKNDSVRFILAQCESLQGNRNRKSLAAAGD